jgi:hypothetical protein
MPFWISIILAFLGMMYFSLFFEAVVILFLSDLIFGIKEQKLLNIYFFSFFSALIFLLLIEFFKKKLKFYKK